ncbi:MAG: hypothetical protein L3K15_02385 [Thermoplasmata archaeon]|nr:hypothetical protein [Thermoplasmata archaeon]
MSPRKSSTSSGNLTHRSRYLGIEVAGAPFVSPRWLERALGERLAAATSSPGRVRLIRLEGRRALVEVNHRVARLARSAWNAPMPGPTGTPVTISTAKTWGTLLKGKAWIRGRTTSGTGDGPAIDST